MVLVHVVCCTLHIARRMLPPVCLHVSCKHLKRGNVPPGRAHLARYSIFSVSAATGREACPSHMDMSAIAGARLSGAFGGMRTNFQWLKASPMRLRGLYACYQPK